MHCYNFISNSGSCKIYQLKATKIKVLVPLDAPIEEQPIPSLPHFNSDPTDVDLNDAPGNTAFVTFELPCLSSQSNVELAGTSNSSQPTSLPPLAKASNPIATPSEQLPINDTNFMLIDLPTSEAKSTSASLVLVESSNKRSKGKAIARHVKDQRS